MKALLSFKISLVLLCFKNELSHQSLHTPVSELDIDISKYRVPCDLKWEPYVQRQPIPNIAVRSTLDNENDYISGLPSQQNKTLKNEGNIIARGKLLGQWIIGSVDSKGIGHFISPKEKKETKLKKYEILTNPNECHLLWEFQSSGSIKSNSLQIANTSIPTRLIYPVGVFETTTGLIKMCTVSKNHKQCIFADKAGHMTTLKELDDFRVLRPVLKKLKIELLDISYTENETLRLVNFMGKDTILNKAKVKVEVAAVQSRSKSDASGRSDFSSTTTKSGQETRQITNGTITSTTTSQSLGATKGVVVPEFTSIEACSTITLPDLQVSFVATGVFSAKLLTAAQIEFILKENGYPGPFIQKDNFTIQARVGGEVFADGPIDTKFFTNPINIRQQNSCTNITKEVGVLKQAKVNELIKKHIGKGKSVTIDMLKDIFRRVHTGTIINN